MKTTVWAWIAAIFLIVMIFSCCGGVKVGPFLPPGPVVYCDYQGQCKDDQHCGFPGVGTRAVCLEGAGDDFTPMPESMKPNPYVGDGGTR